MALIGTGTNRAISTWDIENQSILETAKKMEGGH